MNGTVCYSLLLTSQALVTHPMHTQVFCSLLSLSLSLNGHVWVGGSIKMSGEEGLMYICMREGASKSDAHNAVGVTPLSHRQNVSVMSASCAVNWY